MSFICRYKLSMNKFKGLRRAFKRSKFLSIIGNFW
nr:MAG TPA: hypothetical protein [Caudoviricetes sp.]DAZ45600.1 MAG TPA: hypothetical protein [Caudoviricetes sp.]